MTKNEPTERELFGTFGGVFTPCTLTILGVIMFLRFGQVVGQSGLLYALLIIAAAKAITTMTSLSLSAIATNTRVKGGGAYYLISRSLGVEFGGAIGVFFFLAQAISVAMYVIGFTEAVLHSVPLLRPYSVEVASIVNLATFTCVYIGAGWTIRLQYGILVVLLLAVSVSFIGAAQAFDSSILAANLQPSFTPGEDLFSNFALFFPAVTGIMAGANMSGDLKDPAKSIPRGTLGAVAFTALIYVSQAVLMAGSRDRVELIANPLILKDIAIVPLLVTAGVLAATLSSALGSMMGAPRILQAFARDGVFQFLSFFSVSGGANNEPRRATMLTFLIAQTCVLLADLNAIAPIITMFFMITYGTLNLATFSESISKNPSYRPTFRYCHWSVSLLGAVSCLAVMFLIDPLWAIVSIILMALLRWYIGFREIEARWGDTRSGVIFERLRLSLLRLDGELVHPKNWRPILLALSGVGWTRPHIPVLGHWLTAGHGILSIAQVVTGEMDDHADRQNDYERALRTFIAREDLEAFPAVVVSDDLGTGIEALIQCHGLGGIRPNTVLMGWPSSSERAEAFGTSLRLVQQLRRSLVVARFAETSDDNADPWEVPAGSIDIWWRGRDNGSLMLLLGHLLRQNPAWRDNQIRLIRMVENEAARDDVRKHLTDLAATSRIEATPVAIVSNDVPQTIQTVSAAASITILGFEPPEDGTEEKFFASIEKTVGNLPRVLLIKSAGGMELES